MSNFGRLKSANEHILDRLFPNLCIITKIHLAYTVGIILELHYHQKDFLSNVVLFCKLVQMSNFGPLNSANEHILERLFPNLRQMTELHLGYMVGIIWKLHSHQKDLLCNAVLLL